MKTLTEINNLNSKSSTDNTTNNNTINNTPKYETANTYSNAKVYFSNISPKDDNNLLPTKEKQFTSFSISKTQGGVVWVFVDNYPDKLNTEKIIVLVDKMENGIYQKYKDLTYTIASPTTSDNTYFSFTFTEAGTYKFTVYSKEIQKMASSTVYISYNN